ncbi:MAG: hypothetical protein Q4P08_03905, partial [Eubacteriales bacterium]|nr:hypothetical protein [Eubacteriales bacterium]
AAKKATVQKPAVNQSATKKPAEKKTAAEKQKPNKPSEKKSSEQKSAAQKPSLNKPRESKQIQFKEQAKKDIKHAKEEQLSNPEELIKSIDKAENEAPINLKALLDPRVRRLIVLCAVIMMLILFFTLPSFRIKKFTSTPLRFVSEGQLLQESGLKYNQHFLTRLLNPDFAKTLRGRYVKAEARLKAKFPQIRDVEIKLHFPNTIHFTVLERLPIAAIEIPDGIVLMDRDGIVLGLKNTIPQGVPVIAGLEVRQAKIGDKLEVDLERELNRALSMLSALIEADAASAGELHLMPLLEELRPGAYQRVVIKLRLPANNKSLNLSCAQNDYLTKHFVWLRKVIAAGVFDDRVPGTLDLSGRYQIFKPLDKRGEKEVYQWDGIPIDPAPQAPVMPVEEEPLESEWSEDAWTGEYGDEITYGDDLGYSE